MKVKRILNSNNIWFFLIVYIILLLLPTFLSLFIIMLFRKLNILVESNLILQSVQFIIMLFAIFIFFQILGINFRSIKRTFVQTKQNLKFVLFMIGIGFILCIITQVSIATLENHFLSFLEIPDRNDKIHDSVKTYIFPSFSTITLAPILEELVFRKAIFQTLLIKKSSFLLANFVSAFLFAFLHMNLQHFIMYFLVGTILSFSFKKTDNLLVPIGIHMLLNSSNMIILLIS